MTSIAIRLPTFAVSPRVRPLPPIDEETRLGPESPGTAGRRMPDSPRSSSNNLEPASDMSSEFDASRSSPKLSPKMSYVETLSGVVDPASPVSYRKWRPPPSSPLASARKQPHDAKQDTGRDSFAADNADGSRGGRHGGEAADDAPVARKSNSLSAGNAAVTAPTTENVVHPMPISITFSSPRLPRIESFDASSSMSSDALGGASGRKTTSLQVENASLKISASNMSANLNVPLSESSYYSQRRLSHVLGLSSSGRNLAPQLIARLHDGLKVLNTRHDEVDDFAAGDFDAVPWWQTRIKQHGVSEIANKFTMRFQDPEVERAYDSHQFRTRIAQIRLMTLVTVLLTLPYFIADFLYSNADVTMLVIVRYAAFLPIQVLMTIFVWSQFFKRVSQQGFLFVFCLVFGASFLVSGFLSSQFKVFYFESIAWALIFGFLFLGVKTVFSIWLFLLFVPALVVDPPTTFRVLFIHQVIYQVAFFVFYSYVFERRLREDFLLSRIFEKEGARLKKERKFADDLLLNILPKAIAERVRDKKEVIADGYKSCTVMFAKVVDLGSRGFDDLPAMPSNTSLNESFPFLNRGAKEQTARGKTPLELFLRLNEILVLIDQQLDKYPGVEKIKTMGESYMAAAGVPVFVENHCEILVEFALGILATINQYNATHGTNVGIRIGIHTGAVVAGIIGKVKFVYDMWGDTCNVASRMESTSVKGQVQITSDVRDALGSRFRYEPRGTVVIKGKGQMETFYVIGVGTMPSVERPRPANEPSKRKISKISWSARALDAITSGMAWPTVFQLRHASSADLGKHKPPAETLSVPELTPSLGRSTAYFAHRWMLRTSKVATSITQDTARQLGTSGMSPRPPHPPPASEIPAPVILLNSNEGSSIELQPASSSVKRPPPPSPQQSQPSLAVTDAPTRKTTDPRTVNLEHEYTESEEEAGTDEKESPQFLNLLTLGFRDREKERLFTLHRARNARKIAKSSLAMVLAFHLISAPLTDMFILFGGLVAPSDPDGVMVKYVVIKGVTVAVYSLLLAFLFRWPHVYWHHPVAIDFLSDALHLAFGCVAGGMLSPQFFWGTISSMFFIFLFTKLRFLYSVPLGLLGYGTVKVINNVTPMALVGNESITFNSVFVALLIALIMSDYITEYTERRTFYVNCSLEENRMKIREAKEKSEELLRNILPSTVVVNLKTQKPAPEEYADVSVLCADIVGFTTFCSDKSPTEVVEQLNVIFSMFDKLVTEYAVEKIKTIGDAYIVAAGLPVRTQNHASTICLLALDMQSALSQFNKNREKRLQMRIGIHSGSCVAGLVGSKKFFYDVYGDAISVATIAETNSSPGCVLVTEDCKSRIQSRIESPPFVFTPRREPVDAKRRGKLNCYFISLPEHEEMANAIFQ